MKYSEKCLELARLFIDKTREYETAKSEQAKDLKNLAQQRDVARDNYFKFLSKYSRVDLDAEVE